MPLASKAAMRWGLVWYLGVLAALLRLGSAQEAYPANEYRPSIRISADLHPQKGFANIIINITAATDAHTTGGVASYEIRFGTSASDRLGKEISVVTGASLAAEMQVTFSGATRLTADDSFPAYINAFVLNSDNVANPSPISVNFDDLAVPFQTPMVSTEYNQRDFIDLNAVRDEFFGELTIHLDSYSIEYNDTDATLATITHYNVYPVCAGVVSSTAVWSGPYDQVSKNMDIVGSSNLTYVATGCTNFTNVFVAFAANADGNALSGVMFNLTDLVDAPTLTTDLDVATAEHVAVYTPEKTLTAGALALKYGDYFKLEARWSHADRSQFAWAAYWFCGTRPVYFFDFGTNVNLQTNGTTISVSPAAQYAAPPLACADGYSVKVVGTLSDAERITTHGMETSKSALSASVSVTVAAEPETPTWACPASGPTATIEADAVVGSITGSLVWTTSVSSEYLSATTGRKPDYFVVFGSNDTVEDSGDTRIKIVPYVEAQGTYTWTFAAIDFVEYMYVNAYESSGEGALTTCNKFTSQITEISVTTAPAGITSATFVDDDGNQNRIHGDVTAIIPSDIANGTVVRIYFATGPDSTDTNSATLLDSKTIPDDVVYDVSGNYVKLRVACNSDHFIANVSSADGCDLFIPSTNTQYDYLHVFTVDTSGDSDLFSQPLAIRIIDRNDPYTLLNDVYTYTGLQGNTDIKYYPTVEQTTSNGEIVSGKVTLAWRTANLAAAEVSDGGSTSTLIDLRDVFNYDVVLGSSTDATPDCHLDPSWTGASYPYELDYPANAFGGIENPNVTDSGAFTVFTIVADYAQLVHCGFEADSSNPLLIKGQMTQYILTDESRQDSAGTFMNDYIPQMTITAYVEITYLDTTHASASDVNVINVVVLDDVEEVVETESAVRFYNPGFTSEKTDLNFMAKREKMYVEHYITTNTQMFYVTLTRFWFAQEAFATSQVELQMPSTDAAFSNVDDPVEKARYRFETTVPIVMNCRPCYMHLESKLSLEDPSSGAKKSLPLPKFQPQESKNTNSARALVIDLETAESGSGHIFSAPKSLVMTASAALVFARQLL